ncbi:MAG: FAD-dependent oxidoreductase [Salaquimonas sp.]
MKTQMTPIGTLWEKTAKDNLFENVDLAESLSTDILIIGAGFTGLRCALALAEAGINVVVVDKEYVGFGASARNGGQVNPMLPVVNPAELRNAVGDLWFERIATTSLGSADELFDLIEKYQIQCNVRRNGWLRVNHSEKARQTATKGAQEWNQFGAGFEFYGEEDTIRLSGSPAFKSATLNPKGGAVHPLKLLTGLANAAKTAGAKIYSNAGVDELKRNDGKWFASCGQNKITAGKVVVGTNGYTKGDVWKPLENTILPLCPIQIATDKLPDDIGNEILKEGHTISDTRRLIMYARRETSGEFIFGGIGYKKPNGQVGGYSWLDQDIKKIYPQLSQFKFDYKWTGQIGLTQGRIPQILEPAPGLISGMGYNGRGVAMANVIGRILSDRILGIAPDKLDFPITTIKPMPWRNIQSIGAPLAMAWWRVLDNTEFKR